MREILFKAKRWSDGEWVEGSLIVYPDQTTEIVYDMGSIEEMGKAAVRPETICQYTGLTDKNGKKIFEGDRLRCYVPVYEIGKRTPVGERWLVGTVGWNAPCSEELGHWALFADDENGNPTTYTFSSKFEVIGSIHDGEGGQREAVRGASSKDRRRSHRQGG